MKIKKHTYSVNFAGDLYTNHPTFLIHIKPAKVGYIGIAILKTKARETNGTWVYDPNDIIARVGPFVLEQTAYEQALAAAQLAIGQTAN